MGENVSSLEINKMLYSIFLAPAATAAPGGEQNIFSSDGEFSKLYLVIFKHLSSDCNFKIYR